MTAFWKLALPKTTFLQAFLSEFRLGFFRLGSPERDEFERDEGRWARLGQAILLACLPMALAAAFPGAEAHAQQGGSGQGNAQAGTLEGVVVSAEEEAPLEGVTVAIPVLNRAVVTGAEGTFRFAEVPPGTYYVRARLSGGYPAETRARVPAGETARLRLSIPTEGSSPGSASSGGGSDGGGGSGLFASVGRALSSAGRAIGRTDAALSLSATTMGPALGLEARLTETLRIKAGGSFLPYSYARSFTQDGLSLRATGDLRVGGPSLSVEWHPFASGFYATGGLMYNVSEVTGLVEPTSDYEVSSRKTLSKSAIGKIDGSVRFPAFSPVFAIGHGDAFGGTWGFEIELGARYTGRPDIRLDGTKLAEPTARENEKVLQRGFESFRFYPHLSVGLTRQF